jgi:hypothetical protein
MGKTAIFVMTLVAGYCLGECAEAQKPQPAAVSAPASPAAVKTAVSTGTKVPIAKDTASAAAAAPTGLARIQLRSQPDSAAIVIDSLDRGQTPALIDSLSPGTHTILIKKKGYFVKKITTTLAADSLHDISIVLVKPGCIVVKSDPPGATVFLDNKEAGATPYENAKLKPGAYTLKLQLAQRETVERPLTVMDAGCDTLSISLPFSKAYADSVERAQKAAEKKKSRFKKTVDLIALGAFAVFGAVILFIEVSNAD